MSKEINIKKELWRAAHALELKAFEAEDAQAMSEAAEQKGKLALGMFIDKDAEPQEGFKAGGGVSGSLSSIGPLDGVGVRDEQ